MCPDREGQAEIGLHRWQPAQWSDKERTARSRGRDATKLTKQNQSRLTAEQRLSWGDTLQLRERNDEYLLVVGNIATLPEKASGMKNFALTEMMRRYGVDTIGLTQPDRRWDIIPDEDHFDGRFRGHFPSQQIRAAAGYNRHDKESGSGVVRP